MAIKSKKWVIGFLSVTAAAIALELYSIWDNSEATEPWTYLIINNIPNYVGAPLILIFVAWLIYHFRNYILGRSK